MITCDQCRDDLAEYALGSADAAQAEQVVDHLAACPVCRQELEELQAAWAAMPHSLTPIEPSRDLFDRVLARIDAQRNEAASAAEHRPSRRERVLSYVVAAAVLIGLTASFWQLTQPSGDDAAARRSAERLAERLGNLQKMERLLAAENVRLVSLKQAQSPSPIEAYVIWDLAAGQWHFYAGDLSAPPTDHAYQLWIVDQAGKYIPGPTFDVNDEGLGSAVVDLPKLALRAAAKAVVTVEPAGGSKQPTGKVYLEAAL